MEQQDSYSAGVTNTDQLAVLKKLTQPLTATQLAKKLGYSLDQSSAAFLALASRGIVRCLNPKATRNHLFWLTSQGMTCQRKVLGGRSIQHDLPDVDWELYANVCYSHRSEVIRSLTFAMQPATLRRRAAFRKPGLRMSANNVRDVMRYLLQAGIVRQVPLKKKAHPGYKLTEQGQDFCRLLRKAEEIL